ncbi:MAG: BON domain-containing protein [Planctomycetales bacterium]|nr:BON domain-containing protein [Planctomycetales bacterium]
MRKVLFSLAIATIALAPMARASADEAADRAAAQQIAANLKESGKMKDYRVGVKYQDGVAWLMGTVTNAEQKRLAEQIAGRSAGVDQVVNRLEVAGGELAQAEPAESTMSGQIQQTSMQQARMPQPNMRQAPVQQYGGAPVPYAPAGGVQPAGYGQYAGPAPGGMAPMPMGHMPMQQGGRAVSYDNPQMPNYAWPSYAAQSNYAALTYPQQYSASAWPYIGPFYPYPQVPLGWRKVTLEWDDGWWQLDFKDCKDCH